LEAVTRRLVRTQQAKKTQVCVLVNLLSVWNSNIVTIFVWHNYIFSVQIWSIITP
jgi:hypothetical protein